MNIAKLVAVLGWAAGSAASFGSLSCEAGARRCSRGDPECPIDIRIKSDGSPTVVAGRLSPRRPSFSYRFSAGENVSLGWTFKGPAVRVLLTGPDGDTQGPGLPDHLPLEKNGPYVFSVASNTMADNIYGKFRLSLSLNAQR